MPRKPLIRTADHPYHIYNRSNNKEFFYLPMEMLWPIFNRYLGVAAIRFNLQIHCFCLMNNHFHILLTTPDSNLDQAMHFFGSQLSKAIAHRAGRINKIFGGRYKWSLIKNHQHYFAVYRYIYQNPLRANLCEKVECYSYSSLMPGLLGGHAGTHENDLFQDFDYREKLDWLNQFVSKEKSLEIKKGLLKQEFNPVIER